MEAQIYNLSTNWASQGPPKHVTFKHTMDQSNKIQLLIETTMWTNFKNILRKRHSTQECILYDSKYIYKILLQPKLGNGRRNWLLGKLWEHKTDWEGLEGNEVLVMFHISTGVLVTQVCKFFKIGKYALISYHEIVTSRGKIKKSWVEKKRSLYSSVVWLEW